MSAFHDTSLEGDRETRWDSGDNFLARDGDERGGSGSHDGPQLEFVISLAGERNGEITWIFSHWSWWEEDEGWKRGVVEGREESE